MTDIKQIAAALAADENFIARLAEAVAKRLAEDRRKTGIVADGGEFPPLEASQ